MRAGTPALYVATAGHCDGVEVEKETRLGNLNLNLITNTHELQIEFDRFCDPLISEIDRIITGILMQVKASENELFNKSGEFIVYRFFLALFHLAQCLFGPMSQRR